MGNQASQSWRGPPLTLTLLTARRAAPGPATLAPGDLLLLDPRSEVRVPPSPVTLKWSRVDVTPPAPLIKEREGPLFPRSSQTLRFRAHFSSTRDERLAVDTGHRSARVHVALGRGLSQGCLLGLC